MKRKAEHTEQLTTKEREYVERIIAACGGRRRFRIRQCFRNAQRLMLEDSEKRLRYCEGYVDGWIAHAWVTINGKVVDVTMEAGNRWQKRHFPGHARNDDEPVYSNGRVVNRRTLLRHMGKSKVWDSALGLKDLWELRGQ